ncbi:uncharacterized protein [Struthio camelus]|uniref:uncharacterized protein isoform X6 n=1 Tax=Struthio camelus TaxID=8801 RepID=UPI00360404EF
MEEASLQLQWAPRFESRFVCLPVPRAKALSSPLPQAAVPWRILQPAVQPWPLAWARFCREPGHGLWTREKLKSVSVTWREEGEKGPARGLRQPGSAGSSQQEESVAGMCRCKAEITQLLVLPLAARVCVQAELSWRGALHNAMRSRTPMAKWRNLRCRAVRSVRDTFLDQ